MQCYQSSNANLASYQTNNAYKTGKNGKLAKLTTKTYQVSNTNLASKKHKAFKQARIPKQASKVFKASMLANQS